MINKLVNFSTRLVIPRIIQMILRSKTTVVNLYHLVNMYHNIMFRRKPMNILTVYLIKIIFCKDLTMICNTQNKKTQRFLMTNNSTYTPQKNRSLIKNQRRNFRAINIQFAGMNINYHNNKVTILIYQRLHQ